MMVLAQCMAGTAMFLFWLSGHMGGKETCEKTHLQIFEDGKHSCEKTHKTGRAGDGRFFSLKEK